MSTQNTTSNRGGRKSAATKGAGATSAAVVTQPTVPPLAGPILDASQVTMQRRMRFNPLRSVTPESLSQAHDQFDVGFLRQAMLLWDAMCRRDDTLSFVKAQLEASIAQKPWGVFKRKDADQKEAARHAACLQYFYDHLQAVNAFDRNEKGDRHMVLEQMGSSYAYKYAVHHVRWEPGLETVPVDEEGAEPVPALTAVLEYVPGWFFENTTGELRFLEFGGMGAEGAALDWENGEWICTVGQGAMMAAAACYIFKRLTFQDWTNFNERYSQPKVLGQTTAKKGSDQGNAFAELVRDFNADQGMVVYESQAGAEPPISLIGPEGTASVDIFERFLDRQDRKLTVMFRGSDLRNMSRDKETTGVSAQDKETEALEMAHCARIAASCRQLDRHIIRFCFGEDVKPLAYFGLPDMDDEDAKALIESASFLRDSGVLVDADDVASRLGVTTTEDPTKALQAGGMTPTPGEIPESDDDDDEAFRGYLANIRRLQIIAQEAQAEGDDAKKAQAVAEMAKIQPREPKRKAPVAKKPGSTANAAEQLAVGRIQEIIAAAQARSTANTGGGNPNHDERGRFANGPVVLPDEHWTGTPKEMHERADGIMRGFKSVVNPKLGEVQFTQKGRSKTLFDKRTPHEFQSVQALPELVAKGVWTQSTPDRKGRKDVVAYHRLEATLHIGNARYHAELTIQEASDGKRIANKFYLHRLSEK